MDVHNLIIIYLRKPNKNVKLSICAEPSLFIETLKFKLKIITNKFQFLFEKFIPKFYIITGKKMKISCLNIIFKTITYICNKNKI